MSLELPNAYLLGLKPFLIATPEVLEQSDLSPFGIPIEPAHRLSPLALRATPLLRRLQALDSATFGAEGMPMPHWIFLDGAGLTGAMFGLGSPASDTPPDVIDALGLRSAAEHDSTMLVPHSMYIALPSFEADTWVGHNLASVSAFRPRGPSFRGLGSLTKALALRTLRARCQIGAAQWGAPSLRVHRRLGPLRLLSAWTPAHSKPWTYTYAAELTEARLRHLARDTRCRPEPVAAQCFVDSHDHASLQRLQDDIEAGQHWGIASVEPLPLPRQAPSDEAGAQRIGLCRLRRRGSGSARRAAWVPDA